MKRSIRHIILLLGILQITSPDGAAQPGNDSDIFSSPLYQENFYLFTDRSLYASGEPVLFRVFNRSNSLLKNTLWSRVIYVELINWYNKPVAQGKYQLSFPGASGALMIPDSVTSGSYYLRAYTKWMRNYSPSEYFQLPLAVVNPQKINLAELSTRTPATAGPEKKGSGTVGGIICSTDKAIYGKREKVTVNFERSTANPSPDGYCINVIRKGYLDTGYLYMPGNEENDNTGREALEYYPETKGLSITGQAVSGPERLPVSNRILYLTLLGAAPDCFGLSTDENGKIYFSILRHTGASDILFTFDHKGEDAYEIILDDEFSKEYTGIPGSALDFFHDRRKLVGELMVNKQLEQLYMPSIGDTLLRDERRSGYSFYGPPDLRYYCDDYILLPNLAEFFYELIPNVQLRRDRGRRYLALLDANYTVLYSPPLILLDYVPVLDVESILDVSPGMIEYIDIINTQYIRGSNYYSGIIHLVSKKDDHAGVKLPSGAAFFSFSTYSPEEEILFPDYSIQTGNTRIPDLRTTLYWDPNIELSDEGDNSIEFYTSDIAGEYMIVIQGITKDGHIIRNISEFAVE